MKIIQLAVLMSKFSCCFHESEGIKGLQKACNAFNDAKKHAMQKAFIYYENYLSY